MATLPGARSADRRSFDHLFYTGAAAGVLLLVFAGFARTYYLAGLVQAPSRAPEMGAVLHFPGAAFTLWILLMAAGRVRLFVALGSAGAVLALAVRLLGNLAALQAIRTGYAEVGDPHACYAALVASQVARIAIVRTDAWLGFAHWAARLA